jgi:hypothetical protein
MNKMDYLEKGANSKIIKIFIGLVVCILLGISILCFIEGISEFIQAVNIYIYSQIGV